MKLREIIVGTKVIKTEGDLDVEITGIAHDSRKVRAGNLFVAIPGETYDGTKFIPAAIENGAAAIITESDINLEGRAVKIIVPSSRTALADLSVQYFGNPSRKLTVIGVTGTNGKTTVSYLIDSILRASGKKTALFGTVEIRIGEKVIPFPDQAHTLPAASSAPRTKK